MTLFVDDRKVWQAKTLEGLLKKHGHSFGTEEQDEQARVGLIEKLIAEFKAFVGKDAELNRRLTALHEKRGRAADINLRLQVRQGILLRIRTILRSVAGEVLAAKSPKHREGLQRLRACEDFALPGEPPSPAAATPEPPILPALADDLDQLDAVQPAWLGVRYGPEHPSLQEKHKLGAGAVVVRSVVAGSAAEEAGILRGDTIVGTPGRPFREPGALRELVMLAKPGQQTALEIIRRGKRRTVQVRLHPFPDQVPRLPDKPVVGQDAPPLLDLLPLRGKLPPADSPVLLVFFSTWCGPCKAAYQPLIEWEKQNNIPVVLVSSESEELVEEFLARWTKPIPGRVALDPRGLVTDSFSAGKYPTFVLVREGKIRAVQQGYSKSRGLKIP
jgi:thiol-disulfide isomerase/thioredoxin